MNFTTQQALCPLKNKKKISTQYSQYCSLSLSSKTISSLDQQPKLNHAQKSKTPRIVINSSEFTLIKKFNAAIVLDKNSSRFSYILVIERIENE